MQKSKTEIYQMQKCISPFWPDEVISRIYEKQMTWWTICNKKVRNNALSLLPTFVCLFAAFSNLISKIQLSLILIYSQEVIKIKKCQMKKKIKSQADVLISRLLLQFLWKAESIFVMKSTFCVLFQPVSRWFYSQERFDNSFHSFIHLLGICSLHPVI